MGRQRWADNRRDRYLTSFRSRRIVGRQQAARLVCTSAVQLQQQPTSQQQQQQARAPGGQLLITGQTEPTGAGAMTSHAALALPAVIN